ncbi:hypothetical protein KXR64_22505 [Brucella intermedia]|uniref:hypothetical protein n=1 Tax=Brucella TaxID=234 RepID=UPI0011152BFD|nr:hypothetical protein [Brucella intermedia]
MAVEANSNSRDPAEQLNVIEKNDIPARSARVLVLLAWKGFYMPSNVTISAADAFTHVRIINGIGISLCLSRLLIFAGHFVHDPKRSHISLLHVCWIAVILLWIIKFWWDYLFESQTKTYNAFYTYVLDLLYVFGLFFSCVTLTPDGPTGHLKDRCYFTSRKIWFFSLLIFLNLTQMLSVIDAHSFADGNPAPYLAMIIFGIETIVIILAMCVTSLTFQYLFVLLFLLSDFAAFSIEITI